MNKFFLSACAVVKNEAPYIAEWIEWHLLVGVEHFYIYDNDSTDNLKEVLKPYMDQKLVTYVVDSRFPVQLRAYSDCLVEHGWQSTWIAFIDIDEFIYLRSDKEASVSQVLINLPDDCGALAIAWYMFGSSGYATKEPGLVTERFTKRATWPDKHCKSIVRTSFTRGVAKDPHAFRVHKGFAIYDENLKKLPEEYSVMEGRTADAIAIAHYHTKSEEEYVRRKMNPDSNSGRKYTKERLTEMFEAHDRNEVDDFSLYRHQNLLKQLIFNRRATRSMHYD